MAEAASRGELSELHSLICKWLIEKITSKEAETKDIAVATKFLKDNGIEAAFDVDDSALEDVEKAMRDFAEDQNIVSITG